MRPSRSIAMSLLLACFGAGCATHGDVDSLETQLRQQEDQIVALQSQLNGANTDLRIAREESRLLRDQLHAKGNRTLVSEQAETLSKVETVKFSPLLTSGIDFDGSPGDDGLSALLMPVDADGDLVKLIGSIDLELLDLSLPHGQQSIGQWHFTADEARGQWHRGFMSAGYLFQLKWQQPPAARELTLHGRLVAPDGRQFNATQTVKLKLPHNAPVVPAVYESRTQTSDRFTADTIPTVR